MTKTAHRCTKQCVETRVTPCKQTCVEQSRSLAIHQCWKTPEQTCNTVCKDAQTQGCLGGCGEQAERSCFEECTSTTVQLHTAPTTASTTTKGGDKKTEATKNAPTTSNDKQLTPSERTEPPVSRLAATSSAGTSAALIVGITVGAAAAAGAVALVVGLALSSAAAAPKAASFAPAAMAHTSPLYEAHTAGGVNVLHG